VIKRVTVIIVMVASGLWGFGESRRLTTRQKWMLLLAALVFALIVGVNR
jgi:hypothetical protein